MRIQHNIMAMNAYRNYNRNTSALSKNLEKLSSGYKINRAGDDAAGLAISEKMRAQITGLDAAQKNVKDGISLVNTAEGAMQEVQDMLNRMVYLAQQSANGTYDNEVDRANLQKEVESLKSEINRIADSSNFNGIKLMDGSLDVNADLTTKLDFTVGTGLPPVGTQLDVNTVLHKASVDPDSGSSFSIDMYDYEFSNQKGDSMTISVGDTKIKLTSLAEHKTNGENDTLKGKDLVDKILAGTVANDYTITVDGQQFNAGDKMVIQGQEFKVEAGKDGRMTFTQAKPPKDSTEEINPSMKVKVSGKVVAVKAQYDVDVSGTTLADGDLVKVGDEELTFDTDWATTLAKSTKYDAKVNGNTVTLTAKSGGVGEAPKVSYLSKNATNSTAYAAGGTTGTDGVKANIAIDLGAAAGDTISVGGKQFTHGQDYTAGVEVVIDGVTWVATGDAAAGTKITLAEKNTNEATGKTTISYTDKDGNETVSAASTGTPKKAVAGAYAFEVGAWTGGELDILGTKVAWDGVSAATSLQAAVDAGKLNFEDFTTSVGVAANGTTPTVVLTAKEAGAQATVGYTAPAATDVKIFNGKDFKVTTVEKGSEAIQDPNGDYNTATTVINKVSAADAHRIASTFFTLTEDMVTDGSTLTIGDQKFTFTTDQDMIGEDGYIDATSGDLNKISENLTKAAEKNHVWTVGHEGNGRIFLRETEAHDKEYKADADKGIVKAPSDGWDLRTAEGIAKSLSFTSGQKKTGTALTLQIGDTSDEFNQLKVSIGDIHTKALGIDDIDIGNQKGAQEAVDIIKNAINQVSSIRGDLGAISNRLDHTANNLSVMAENITDAESTIRDTDIAAEMMSYTKNNILVQSAQAMLAQANQVPQGVLQLLQ